MSIICKKNKKINNEIDKEIKNKEIQNSPKFFIAELTIQRDHLNELYSSLAGQNDKTLLII